MKHDYLLTELATDIAYRLRHGDRHLLHGAIRQDRVTQPGPDYNAVHVIIEDVNRGQRKFKITVVRDD